MKLTAFCIQCIQAKISKTLDKRSTLIFAANCTEQKPCELIRKLLPYPEFEFIKVEMQQASLLYYSAKPQSGGILRCALVCPTSLYVRTILFPTFCRSLPSVGAYSQYPAWSGCRRSADVLRADHDRVGSSPWNVGKYQNGTSYTRVSARHNWDARAPL